MNEPPSVKRPAAKPRGRPRSPATRDRVLQAARALLDEGGPTAVTMEAVAARSGVGKSSIYRRWPNAHAVLMTALMEGERGASARGRRISPLAALQTQLREIVRAFAARRGRTVAMMLAAADDDTELAKAFRQYVILARRQEGRALLTAAAESGEVRPDIDVDVVLDLLYGPIFFRILVGHAPADEAFAEALFEEVTRGIESPQDRARY